MADQKSKRIILKAKKPNGFEESKGNFQEPKKADNEDDKDKEDDNVNDNNNDIISDSCVDGLQDIINFYNENIGLITPYGLEILQDYTKEMPTDLIIYAMKISVEANKKTIQYIKAILNNWQKAGIRTLIDAKKESQKGKKTKENFKQRKYENLDFLYQNKGDVEDGQ